ncbi:MAG: hypothetical protein HY424_03220 [Candidatus Levybacteria bacterium]|nr:hypothetical protein [Candidatus Levybacteria bacterium]
MKNKTEQVISREIHIDFCKAPSKAFMRSLCKLGGDPRSVIGQRAINESGSRAERGWRPAWDARNTL